MVAMGERVFVDLRRLLDWFEAQPRRLPAHIARSVERLGSRCVPLLARELCGDDDVRRDAARDALFGLAANPTTRGRVLRELRTIAEGGQPDRGKLAALGLLGEFGDRPTARFSDPAAVQRSSVTAFAAALNSPVDIATAADLIVRQLALDTVLSFLTVMVQAAPDRAAQLARELCCRHDIGPIMRERIAELVPLGAVAVATARTQLRPSRVTVLARDERSDSDSLGATCRTVVIVTRKISGQRRWRRWAVLVGSSGDIDDCIHEETPDDTDAAELIDRLTVDGFNVTSTEVAHARSIVIDAARRTIARNTSTSTLPSPYYIGRDLLDLEDAHLVRAPIHPTSATLGRAVELIASDDVSTARALLACCDNTNPDVAAANASCLLLDGQWKAAVEQLQVAISGEPMWALHHWNLAVALYHLDDAPGCHAALQQFLTTSAAPSGLYGDPDQVGRVTRAAHLIATLERTFQLATETQRLPHEPGPRVHLN